jgi:hypothetical protein
MRKLIFLVVWLVLTAPGNLFGQIQNLGGAANTVLREKDYIAVDGSPYLFEDWRNGNIKYQSTITEDLQIKYDCFRDEVQFLRDGKSYAVESGSVQEFEFKFYDKEQSTVQRLVFRNGFTVEGYKKLGYFNVLYDGKTKFLRKVKVDYIDEMVSTYGTEEKRKKFSRKEFYYILTSDGRAIPLKGNRKGVVTLFGPKEAEMSGYTKENKLDLKDNEDMIKVLARFDSLETLQE